MVSTPETIGNQHGLLCPHCEKGDQLRIAATVWADLLPNGTDSSDSDTEWGDDSPVVCRGCSWAGRVENLVLADNFEEE